MERNHLTKRRKSKENSSPKESYTEKSRKRSVIKYSWRQTGSEVIINLIYGPGLDDTCYTLSSSNRHCAVQFKDGREWECQFYQSVVDAGTSAECRGSHLCLMLIKHVPDVTWPQLEIGCDETEGNRETIADDDREDSPNVEGFTSLEVRDDPLPGMSQDEESWDPESGDDVSLFENKNLSLAPKGLDSDDDIMSLEARPLEVPEVEVETEDIKTDLYERSLELCVICLYVKSVPKNTVGIEIGDEQYLTVTFRTSDEKFLRKYDGATPQTRFAWRVKLKERVHSTRYEVECRVSTISLTLHKKDPLKRWDSIEAPAETKTRKVGQVTPDTWLPVVKPTTPAAATKTTPPAVIPLGYSSLQSRPSQASLDNLKKPTCMVSPMNKVASMDLAVAPGLTGLENLGNTCFMNSVVQCLANTREFRDYFLETHFKKDINAWNPLGMGGKLALSFAILCNSLWNGMRRSIEPSNLKSLVAMKASQFTGFAQHDAQEFMAFLLDGLHEDLNRIEQRPYIETRDWDGRPDEVVADEAWEAYKKRNDSVVVDLFQGQYKSKLVCPVCGKVSITFDPFLYLSVPLPKRMRHIPVVFFYKDPYRPPVKYSARVPHDATADDLKEQLARAFKLTAENIRVFEVYKNKIHRFLSRGQSLGSISPTDIILAFEVWSEKSAGEPVIEVNVVQRVIIPSGALRCSYCKRDSPSGQTLRRCTKCRRASYCGLECQKSHWSVHKANCKYSPELVGLPFVVSLPKRKATYFNLCETMEAYASYSVDVFRPPVQTAETLHHCINPTANDARDGTQSASIAANDGLGVSEHAEDSLELTSFRSPEPLGATLDDEPLHQRLLGGSDLKPAAVVPRSCDTDGPTVQMVFGQLRSGSKTERWEPLFYITPVNHCGITLSGADGLHLEDRGEEPLDLGGLPHLALDWQNDDKAKMYVMIQTKDLDVDTAEEERFGTDENGNFTLDQCLTLFTEPEVLSPEEAWYCPRCRRHREATKQMALWRLPPILIVQLKRFSFKSLIWRDKIDKLVEYPIRGLDLSPYCCGPTVTASSPPPIYDLYAVINHHGSILGGHYTATARLLESNGSARSEIGWRMFDDSHVTFTPEASAMSKLAYMLFYRRRDMPVRLVASTRVAGVGPMEAAAQSPHAAFSDEADVEDEDWSLDGRKNLTSASGADSRPPLVCTSKHVP